MTVTTGVPDPGVTVPWRLLTPEGSDQFPHKKDCQIILQNFGARADGPRVKRTICEKQKEGEVESIRTFFVMEPGFHLLGHCWVLRVRDWRADL